MTMRRIWKPAVLLGLGALLGTQGATLARQTGRSPVAASAYFAFYSDLDTNINDALVAAGLARKNGKPELFHSGDEVPCFEKMPPSVSAGWDAAVSYYAKVISPSDWSSREQYLLRAQLAGFDDQLANPEDRQFAEIARSFRGAATPAYTACRWAAQDAKNRRWIEALKPRLESDEKRLASRLEKLYQRRWDGLPIPVDVVETVDWSGANSILREPVTGHLLISTANEGPAALEVAFHEASHLLMGRGAPLRKALEEAASAARWRLPGDLWHVVLFYTTGEAVRPFLDGKDKPAYKPMLYEIFERGTWVAYRVPLEAAWRPYIDGKRSLSESAANLVEALKQSEPTPGAADEPMR